MPLFRKAPPGTAPAVPAAQDFPAPTVDPLLGDPDAHRLQAELAQGRWQALHDFLPSVTDWDYRSFYVNELSDFDGWPGWLDTWAAAHPESAVPYLFRGSHSVAWAWRARGGGRAATVGQDAWQLFHTRLVAAERELRHAAALDPADPTPHAGLVRCAVGLGLGLPEISRRFAQVTSRDRWSRAHHSMLQATAAKWYGSHEQMFAFARSASAQAPEGSGMYALIPYAHLEVWLNLPRESADGQHRQASYFSQPAVFQEIQVAAARSIRSPRFTAGRLGLRDRNTFAMCFYLMQDYRSQLEQMDLIGPMVQQLPWGYLGDPGRAYGGAWRRAQEVTMGAGAVPQGR